MPVIAIVNRKGGCGKSTLATHLAAYCANAGLAVMLGDVDQQQSTKTWLRLRAHHLPPEKQNILGWAVEPSRGLRPPAGTTHVILDTPGGLTGFELARVALFADAILMPVCNSAFDRESAAACLAELSTLPRVASGRCRLGAVGMRVNARNSSAKVLRDWANALQLPFIGVLRDTPLYVRCIETGRSLFDLPKDSVRPDLLEWAPILQWLGPMIEANSGAAVQTAPQRPDQGRCPSNFHVPKASSLAAGATSPADSQTSLLADLPDPLTTAQTPTSTPATDARMLASQDRPLPPLALPGERLGTSTLAASLEKAPGMRTRHMDFPQIISMLALAMRKLTFR